MSMEAFSDNVAYMAARIDGNFRTYGTRPECRHCRIPCGGKQYNAPASRVICPRSPDFLIEELKLNGNRIDPS